MENLIDLVSRIQARALGLQAKVTALQLENREYHSKMDELERIKEQNSIKIKQLENNINLLKISSNIQDREIDTSNAKKNIGELVKEIDKCIQILSNKQ